MLTEEIIFLIKKIRRESKVRQELLCRGICTTQQLSKLEKGQRQPDFFLLEVLLQRLGKSMDKLEIVLSEEEFNEIRERDDIIDDLRRGRTREAEGKLEHFRKIMEEGLAENVAGVVRQMNVYRLQGILAFETGDYEEAERNLCRAAEISVGETAQTVFPFGTVPAQMDFEDMLFADVELENLIMLAQVFQRLRKPAFAEKLLEQVHGYVRRQISDKEQLAKFLPRIAVVFIDICKDLGEPDETVSLCEEALELLRKHNMLQNITLLLGSLAEAYGRSGQAEKKRVYIVWKKVIAQVYEYFGLRVDIINKLYFNSCVGQYYLIGELIREERQAQMLSQEQLIEGIYGNPESLSRVENGKKPDRKKLQLLFEKLGIQRRRFGGRVITDDYSLLELYIEINIAMNRKENERGMEGLAQLKKKLDMSIPENRQAVGGFEIRDHYSHGMMSKEEAFRRIEELLRLTYRENSGRVPFEGEALLLNQLGILYALMGRWDEAIALHKRVIDCYKNSKVPLKYHFRFVYLFMENMSCDMSHMKYNEDTIFWSRELMMADLQNGKGTSLHVMLSNLIGCEMNTGGDRELCETYTKWAFYLSDIFKQYHDQKYLIDYEKKHFNENVEWY